MPSPKPDHDPDHPSTAEQDYALLDQIDPRAYQDIAEIAAVLCGTPIAYVSLVKDGRQWFKASRGLPFEENHDPETFCTQTVRRAQTVIVPDTLRDPLFQVNPYVVGEPHIRFYAGTPILSPDGQILGTVCVVDLAPHALTPQQTAGLEALSRQIAALLVQARATAQEADAARALALAATRLKQLADRLQIALEAGKIASWEWDLATDSFLWDEGSAWIYGRPPEDLATVDQMFKHLAPEDLDQVTEDLKPALEGTGDFYSEFRVIWPDASVHWIVAFGRPVPDPSGVPTKIIGVNLEITERKLSEAALIRNEKLAAVGRLSSSIAHEINNPLESVTNLIYLAKQTDDIAEARSFLTLADGELRRASAITKQTLRFHKQSTRATPAVCDALIGSVLSIYESRITNAEISLRKRKRSSRPIICFEGEIQQVLSNLIGNAIDAMQAEGGTLILRSRDGHDWRTGAPGLYLTVADTGPGMSKRVLEKIFEAFFTTKGIGGTGLGLWISKDIILRHNGNFNVRTSQHPRHHGTVFSIFLPVEPALRPST